ncbi:MAG: hypothetical protein LBT48_03940 [Prevotellaceae bacterium]|jgi:hypothetical protein|nr:hypothetical protein [Prevotellaceae bacterium]
MKQKNIKTTFATIVGIVVGMLLGSYAVSLVFKKPSIDQELVKISNELNKSCPMMIDAVTRLDHTMALPDNTFQYNYTITDVDKETIDTLAIKELMTPQIVNYFKTSPQTQFFRTHKVSLNYYYQDETGIYVCAISIKPEQYAE